MQIFDPVFWTVFLRQETYFVIFLPPDKNENKICSAFLTCPANTGVLKTKRMTSRRKLVEEGTGESRRPLQMWVTENYRR